VKELEPLEVLPGKNVTFTSVIRGTPPFKVGWFRGARELVKGDKCNIYFEDTVAELELFNIDISQSGEYTCVVSNGAGQTSCTTHLFVKGLLKCIHSSYLQLLTSLCVCVCVCVCVYVCV
jgi:titin